MIIDSIFLLYKVYFQENSLRKNYVILSFPLIVKIYLFVMYLEFSASQTNCFKEFHIDVHHW